MVQEGHPHSSPAMQSEDLSLAGKTALDASYKDEGSSSHDHTTTASPTVAERAGTLPVCTTFFSGVPRFEEASLQSADSPLMTKASNTSLKQPSETEVLGLLSPVPDAPCHILEVVAPDAAINSALPFPPPSQPPSDLVEETPRIVEDELVDKQVPSHTAPPGAQKSEVGFLRLASPIPLLVRFTTCHGLGTSLRLSLCSRWTRKALHALHLAKYLNWTKNSNWIHPRCLNRLDLPQSLAYPRKIPRPMCLS